MVAQSMARELGPLAIHVAHVLVDGATRAITRSASRGDSFAIKLVPEMLFAEQLAADLIVVGTGKSDRRASLGARSVSGSGFLLPNG